MVLQLPALPTKLKPWPIRDGIDSRSDTLDLAVKISTTTGWLDLEDGAHYAVHGESFADRAYTYRTRSVNSEFIEGSYAVTSVRENVTEALVVWVKGDDHYEWRTYLDKFTSALEQLRFQLMVRMENSVEYWDCQPANYNVQTQREFIHAKLAVVRAQVPRLPAVLRSLATSAET